MSADEQETHDNCIFGIGSDTVVLWRFSIPDLGFITNCSIAMSQFQDLNIKN